jgi:HPt (histidine-containing phosphotransfer) domain-containing protein
MDRSSSLAETLGNPTAPIPDFSLETLLESIGDDRDFAAELLALFLEQTPDQLQQIRLAQEKKDFAAISRIIHTQKAPFPVFGLTQVAAAGHAIEVYMADTGHDEDTCLLVDQYIQILTAELPHMQAALDTINQA